VERDFVVKFSFEEVERRTFWMWGGSVGARRGGGVAFCLVGWC
jgi:hypothetical protein